MTETGRPPCAKPSESRIGRILETPGGSNPLDSDPNGATVVDLGKSWDRGALGETHSALGLQAPVAGSQLGQP
jgi:hypothetical protein